MITYAKLSEPRRLDALPNKPALLESCASGLSQTCIQATKGIVVSRELRREVGLGTESLVLEHSSPDLCQRAAMEFTSTVLVADLAITHMSEKGSEKRIRTWGSNSKASPAGSIFACCSRKVVRSASAVQKRLSFRHTL
jgi:hypothetical protein